MSTKSKIIIAVLGLLLFAMRGNYKKPLQDKQTIEQ